MIAADASDTDNKISALKGRRGHPESFGAIGLQPVLFQRPRAFLRQRLGAFFDQALKEAMAHPLARPLQPVKDSDRPHPMAKHSALVLVAVNPLDSDPNPPDPGFPWNSLGLEAAHP